MNCSYSCDIQICEYIYVLTWTPNLACSGYLGYWFYILKYMHVTILVHEIVDQIDKHFNNN